MISSEPIVKTKMINVKMTEEQFESLMELLINIKEAHDGGVKVQRCKKNK